MSIPKPRRYTYYERIKATFNNIQDITAKPLCDSILSFIENCFGDARPNILDFTDRKTEEKICQFLLKDREFFNRIFVHFKEFFSRDLSFKGGSLAKDLSMSPTTLLKNIEKLSYEVICLSALYSPLELQKTYISMLATFLAKNQPESIFTQVELTAWTALLLMINPVKLKKQCDVDGSTEVFVHFKNVLGSMTVRGSTNPDIKWLNSCLKATIQLALGVSIKYARNPLGLGIPHELDEIELVNDAIANMSMEFLHAFIVQVPLFCEYSFSVDVIDSVIKNFICYFPEKIVEMYNLCEEELYSLAELQGNINGDQKCIKQLHNFANLHFKVLLELIAALYEPENAHLMQLSLEFTDPNCEALCDFICKGRAISAPALKIAYLSMLKSLCKSSQSAEIFFTIFK